MLRDSAVLQHRRDLFAAGLIDNPSISCDLSRRRKAYEECVHKWSDTRKAVKSVYDLPQEIFSESHTITVLGGNLLASYIWRGRRVNFIRVPTAVSQKPIEWWTLPPFPFGIEDFAAYAPDNVFVVAEIKEE